MKISISRESMYWLVVVVLCLVVGFSQYAHAWTSPTTLPPGGNVAGPLTTGVGSQIKAGGDISLGGAGSLLAGSWVAGDDFLARKTITAPQFCLGTSPQTGSCITAWPSGGGGGGGGGGGVGGSGTVNYLPIWTGTTLLGNSPISYASGQGVTINSWVYGYQTINAALGLYGPFFTDTDNQNYVVNPSGQSNLYTSYFSGWVSAPAYYDYFNPSYYVMPGGTSYVMSINANDLYIRGSLTSAGGFASISGGVDVGGNIRSAGGVIAPAFFDYNDQSYNVDPAGTSRMNVIVYNTVNQVSDESLKKNIQTIPNALTDVLKLRGVEFNWKKDGRLDLGVIAQEVEKVFPQLVNTDTTTGLKSVEYPNLIGPLIEAVKEQQKEIEALQKEIEELKR